ncbi:MAG: DUF1223 domain-containing protein [Pyrinomonadaceae bacterium]|nr:DUF1223 domain-containing protein [Pyrinomonadaceae bacterium]
MGCTAQAFERDFTDDSVKKSFSKSLLVELFTSEGCSSCPPAEALLARYETEQPFEPVEIITLAFHVDYWDGLGWKDKYASPLFTQRQKVYDRKFRTGQIYTPQMVVDGDIEFIGSREKAAKKAVKKASKRQKANITVVVTDKKVNVSVVGLRNEEPATVYLAFAEDGLGSRVEAGENAGKELTHVSLVRELRGIARVQTDAGSYSGLFDLNLKEEWSSENLRIVAFVQENFSRDVVAVTRSGYVSASLEP